jgi:hypothetical protein
MGVLNRDELSMNAVKESSDFETGNCCVPTPENTKNLLLHQTAVTMDSAKWSNFVDCGGYNPKSKIKK